MIFSKERPQRSGVGLVTPDLTVASWVHADLHVLDSYVNQRVDCMIDAGLLDEMCIYV